jgi:hypothetical protein
VVDEKPLPLAAVAAEWEAGARAPSPRFDQARSAAHWAVQLVSAVGWTLATARSDDGQSALEWSEQDRALLGVVVERNGRAARAGLRLADLTLLALGSESSDRDELRLAGQTLAAGRTWLAVALAQIFRAPIPRLEVPPNQIPPDPVGSGAPFGAPDPAAAAELAAWFASADRVLRAIATSTPEASETRCWPHHFDIATLLRLDGAGAPPESARTIGVGLSPGDGSYAEPYWYVTPWPPPARADRPALPQGSWHTQGWLGAVLPAAALAGAKTAADAGARVATFLSAAIAACRRLLAAPDSPPGPSAAGSTVTGR